MEKLDFIRQFRAEARQLAVYAQADEWLRLAEELAEEGIRLSAWRAATYANRGYTANEAAPLIRTNRS